jgi:signal transduction histidine kinase
LDPGAAGCSHAGAEQPDHARNERGLTVHEEPDTAGLGDRRVHATLEPAVISGDRVLAERLIANLVDNAVRYNVAASDIWISTRTMTGSSQLTVANTGPVISPAEADRHFQPFQRLGDRTSHDGFGLGLAIVASIAAIHGGTVSARPRNDGGLSATVAIPPAGAPARFGEESPPRLLFSGVWTSKTKCYHCIPIQNDYDVI